MKPWLILINDFCHDLFTGLWFGSFVTLYILHRKATSGLDVSQTALMNDLTGIFFWLTFASLGAIIATGICRFFYYRDWDGIPVKEVKKRLLIIKHAVLGTSFLVGTGLVFAWGI